MTRELDVRSYGATVDEFKTLYEKVVNLHPNLFYANGGYGYTYYPSTNVIASVTLHYTSSSDAEIAQQRVEYAAAKKALLALFPSGATDLEKVKIIHDWLVRNIEYSTGADGLSGYNAYGALVNNKAVCQGYSMLMRAVLDDLGIPCVYAVQEISEDDRHMWNMVQVDGLWYHVDATWDDGGNGKYATPSTTYFMKSGVWMSANPSSEGYHAFWDVLPGDVNPDTEASTLYDEWTHWPYWPPADTKGQPLVSFALSSERIECEVGKERTAELWVDDVDPLDTRPLHATWTSSNPSVASFAWPGYVTYGTKVGTSLITCELEGKKHTCLVKVTGKLADAKVSAVADQMWTGKEIRPSVTVTYGGTKLVAGTDYDVSYQNNVNVGTATITLEGKGNYTGSKSATFKIVGPDSVPVYRLYNKKTSEHLYTINYGEFRDLPRITKGDWVQEGIAWYAPKKSKTPVYRLYNKKSGDHHYTTSKQEANTLVKRHGWTLETTAFYSDDAKRLPLYRLYNGRLQRGQHHYTASLQERNVLSSKHGWKYETIGFYGVKAK